MSLRGANKKLTSTGAASGSNGAAGGSSASTGAGSLSGGSSTTDISALTLLV